MSLHDTLTRLATVDDDETAEVIAIQLNADMAIRQRVSGSTIFNAEAVKRVARALADHAGIGALIPRKAAVLAMEDELRRMNVTPPEVPKAAE